MYIFTAGDCWSSLFMEKDLVTLVERSIAYLLPQRPSSHVWSSLRAI